MSAVEEIQAAIDKLERLRVLVDVPPLVRWHDQEGIPGWDGFIVIGDSAEEGDDCNPVARVYTDELAEMLVTLHRTIDAQLAILNKFAEYRSLWMEESAMALAKAINGGTK